MHGAPVCLSHSSHPLLAALAAAPFPARRHHLRRMLPMKTADLEHKLATLAARYEELNTLMSQPQTLSDPALLQRYGREYASLTDVVGSYNALKHARKQLAETEQMLGDGLDEELRELAREEQEQLRAREAGLLHDIQIALLPKDIMDERDAIVTIQAGAGGDEAGLFAADLARMYMRYADAKRWTVEVLDSNASGIGGYKKLVMEGHGRGAYARLKYEGGPHRVQRGPATHSHGPLPPPPPHVILP